MSGRLRTWYPVALAACASASTFPAARFVNHPAVSIVDDRRDVPQPPLKNGTVFALYALDTSIHRPVTRALELPRARRALGVNAIDEVPDSTWFTNRNAVRPLTPDEIRTGPLTSDSPDKHTPWTILSTKVGGSEGGFVVRDTRGVKYLIKFDWRDQPEVETGSDVVVNRLLWAAGYNVPEDQIAFVHPSELVLGPGATVKDTFGVDQRELRPTDVEKRIADAVHLPDGRLRVLASRWLPGKSVGGPSPEGVREDDPNDRIPHELRRDLRGAYSIFSWVDHVDVIQDNFLDMWIADPANPSRHYVQHYAIDFGKSLGAMGALELDRRRSYTYRVDVPDLVREVASVGIDDRPWEHRVAPRVRGVADLFDAASFNPGDWHPDYRFVPFDDSDRFDKFWGAKIVASFTRDQIRAAVEAGQYSDPRAVQYLTDTLVARQRRVIQYWFAQVNPLDRFTIAENSALCFEDLAVTAGIASAADTHYEIAMFDQSARAVGAPYTVTAATQGPSCTPAVTLTGDRDGYTIVEIKTMRPSFRGSTLVHLARDPISGVPRVIGIWRT